MRAPTLLVVAVCLAAFVGCDNQPADETMVSDASPFSAEESVAPAPVPAGPRVNLYPMSLPPPGSLQPLAGSAPPAGYAPSPYGAGPYAAAAPAPSPQPSPYQSLIRQEPYQSSVQPVYQPPVTGVYQEPVAATPYQPAPTPLYQPPAPAVSVPYVGGPAPLGHYAVSVEEVTSTSSQYVPLMDPPVLVDNQYYQSSSVIPNQSYPASTGFRYQPAPAPSPVPPTVIYTPETLYAPTPAYPPAATSLPAPPAAVSAPAVYSTAAPVTASAPLATSFRLVPAPDVPPGIHPNDAAPSQWFEIIRPGNGPIRIGRVSSTCVCVGVRVPNRHVAAGERALIEARVVTRPPVNNLTYGMYVNVLEPENMMLDADVTIRL